MLYGSPIDSFQLCAQPSTLARIDSVWPDSAKLLYGCMGLTRPVGDSSEVYNTATNPLNDTQSTFHADWNYRAETEWDRGESEFDANHDPDVSDIILEDGSMVLMKTKKPINLATLQGVANRPPRGGPSKPIVAFQIGKDKDKGNPYVFVAATPSIVGGNALIRPGVNLVRDSRREEKGLYR